jgi:hypothetical protein
MVASVCSAADRYRRIGMVGADGIARAHAGSGPTVFGSLRDCGVVPSPIWTVLMTLPRSSTPRWGAPHVNEPEMLVLCRWKMPLRCAALGQPSGLSHISHRAAATAM